MTGRPPKGGSLDKEIIRRVIRRHIPAVRACYEAVMVAKPFPSGRVMTRFAIDAEGKVTHTCVVNTTLNQTPAEACIVDEMLRWEFPKPIGGGWVVVDYPFVLVPDVPPAPKDDESDAP